MAAKNNTMNWMTFIEEVHKEVSPRMEEVSKKYYKGKISYGLLKGESETLVKEVREIIHRNYDLAAQIACRSCIAPLTTNIDEEIFDELSNNMVGKYVVGPEHDISIAHPYVPFTQYYHNYIIDFQRRALWTVVNIECKDIETEAPKNGAGEYAVKEYADLVTNHMYDALGKAYNHPDFRKNTLWRPNAGFNSNIALLKGYDRLPIMNSMDTVYSILTEDELCANWIRDTIREYANLMGTENQNHIIFSMIDPFMSRSIISPRAFATKLFPHDVYDGIIGPNADYVDNIRTEFFWKARELDGTFFNYFIKSRIKDNDGVVVCFMNAANPSLMDDIIKMRSKGSLIKKLLEKKVEFSKNPNLGVECFRFDI